ncbi:MAG TPA: PAS domain S-box protein [Verrucomicrobiales bacterium]|nr:PAS domain S-box protein [Verrucomicrobiales bacterium]
MSSASSLLAAIVDSSDDAIISKDLNGIVTSWNKAAERIFGYTAGEMIGKPITVLFPPDRQNEEPAILDRLRRGERVDHFETVRVRRNGETVNVSLTISPVKDEQGRIVGASKIARDISEKKTWEAALVASSQEAERHSRIKDEFLATLSHELRTPLQSILSWIQLLKDDPQPSDISEGVAVIERSALAQSRIVEDLLDMNRILSGKVRLEVQAVSLAAVIEQALATVKLAAEAKGVRLESVLDPLPLSINGDPARLQQIFWNLLSNAIKFTPRDGKVQITLQRVNSHVEIIVCDTGIGISHEFLPFVFDRFRQADATTTRKHGGLGLGLAIVKHLAELHGGSVKVRSQGPGKGAAFTVLLPMPIVQTGEVAETRRHPSGGASSFEPLDRPNISGISILLVDDEIDSRTVLAHLLTRAGAKVFMAGSAPSALEALQREMPDVLISDVGMPGMDGVELIRAVRRLSASHGGRIPAIALTAYSRKEDRIKAISAGFQAHIAKPADIVEILTMVSSLGRKQPAGPDGGG